MALMYKQFAKDFTVYVFSRKSPLPNGITTRDMATDLAKAMKQLDITKACVMGVSQGGMIAQYLAIDFPELLEKLALAVTLCKPNETSEKVICNWLELAKNNDFKQLFIDTAEKIYSENKLKTYRPLYGVLSKMSRPKSLDRFIVQANACLTHDASNEISEIRCPTLVLGGDSDKVVGSGAARELADLIPDSRLIIYDGLGHGAYEESKSFNSDLLSFFNS